MVQEKELEIEYISTQEMLANGFTKPLAKDKHRQFVADMNLMTALEEE
jgi:hypothetical protein